MPLCTKIQLYEHTVSLTEIKLTPAVLFAVVTLDEGCVRMCRRCAVPCLSPTSLSVRRQVAHHRCGVAAVLAPPALHHAHHLHPSAPCFLMPTPLRLSAIARSLFTSPWLVSSQWLPVSLRAVLRVTIWYVLLVVTLYAYLWYVLLENTPYVYKW